MNPKTIYWISTSLISLMLLWSAYTYIFTQSVIEGVKELGFPNFFRIQLAVLKLLAVFVLMLPIFSLQMKEWAYAGVGLFFLTALVAHISHQDSWGISVFLLVLLALLAVSNVYLNRIYIG